MAYEKESPKERITRFGVRSVSAIDLLSVILAEDSNSSSEIEETARLWIKENKLHRVTDLSHSELNSFGISDPILSLKILAALELGRRSAYAGTGPVEFIDNPSDVIKFFDYLVHEKKEHFCALYLNSKNKILCARTVHIGTINMSIVGMREVFREAIREGAASIIAVHNHPSGDPEPSEADKIITHKLKESGLLLGIPLLDHIIIGHQSHYSFQEQNKC